MDDVEADGTCRSRVGDVGVVGEDGVDGGSGCSRRRGDDVVVIVVNDEEDSVDDDDDVEWRGQNEEQEIDGRRHGHRARKESSLLLL